MGLQFYNTLTRSKQLFKPLHKGKVGLYTCGPTVYNYAHIGNFRAYVCSDILRRYLAYSGYTVTHVMNITDVDDKTIRNAQQEKMTLKAFTEKYTQAFFEDIDKLALLRAHHFPRATHHIEEMVAMIKTLLTKGLAYKGDDGSVYYAIAKFKNYGKLSKIKVDKQKKGVRISHDEYDKDNAHDFALWKAYSKEDGDMYWETELGKGRPGWHIECSAMSVAYLGQCFDIHTGGVDLIFPHHENEIAQSEGCFGKPFVQYWLHNDYMLVNGKKMSKSLGNFFTLRDLEQKGYSLPAIRYLLLSAHYRAQLNFTEEGLQSAEQTVARLRECICKLQEIEKKDKSEKPHYISALLPAIKEDFEKQMDDDLNIANALSVLFDFIKSVNGYLDQDEVTRKDAQGCLQLLHSFNNVLAIMDFSEENIPSEIMRLVAEREHARQTKDWKAADRIRKQITAKGYHVDDTKDGPRIKQSS
ncbi:cysteine--tRNA ligase [Candidatus Woesearchaeota archaeon]|nr:cysteine--tRNA ligase [Candidatus Woesearchaeota archaeon]